MVIIAFDLSLIGIKKNIPKVDFRDYSGLLQGGVKIGKTTLAQLLGKTILVGFEKGYEDKVIDYIDCTEEDGWSQFIEFVDNLEEHREEIGNEIKLIAFDTLERMYGSVDYYTCRRKSIEDGKNYKTIQDIPHGRGYLEKDNDFEKQIKRIYQLGFRPLYITHTQVKTIRPKTVRVEPYDIIVPTIPDRCMNIIKPEVSYIISMERTVIDGEKTRVLRIEGVDGVEVGSRVYIDEDIPFETEAEAIEKFENAWRNVISKRLKEAGIKTDIDVLQEQQDKERLNGVLSEMEKTEVKTKKQLSDYCKKLVEEKTLTQKQLMAILKDFGYTSLEINDPDDIKTIYLTIKEKVA